MARWIFEPGHTGATFAVRHMMVTEVRGQFKDVHGQIEFDEQDPARGSVEATIDARKIWTGDAERDAHLRSPDFLDVDHHPQIRFSGRVAKVVGPAEFQVIGDLTIRGTTRQVPLSVRCNGEWNTPWWEGGVDRGPKRRAGFVATTEINRHDFGVSWNSPLEKGGVVVGDRVAITIDAEAILEPETG
jgi:polyisoprenoid-binding protein YceI